MQFRLYFALLSSCPRASSGCWFRSFFSSVCVFPFVFHHNPWTPSSLAVFPLYPSNSSPCHIICYTCLHCFHQILAAVTKFVRIVPILSSNSESVRKTGLVFAYELGFLTFHISKSIRKKFQIHPFLAMPGSDIFILVKKWSQDPLFVITRLLSILSKFSENSTGHVFHLFELIFFVVTSFMLLSNGKISKK